MGGGGGGRVSPSPKWSCDRLIPFLENTYLFFFLNGIDIFRIFYIQDSNYVLFSRSNQHNNDWRRPYSEGGRATLKSKEGGGTGEGAPGYLLIQRNTEIWSE